MNFMAFFLFFILFGLFCVDYAKFRPSQYEYFFDTKFFETIEI